MKKFILMFLAAIVPATLFAADYWRKIPVPSGKNLLAVSFGSPMTGYIGGTDSTLLKTIDGGATWTAIKPSGILFTATTPDIIDLEFVSATTGFAVISKRSNPELRGTIYKTTDGGLSWNEEAAPIACFRTFFFDDENGLALGSGFFSGKNVTRLKAGVWQSPKYLDYSPSFFLRAVDFFDLNTGIVGGDSGKVYRTFDGGITWDTVQANIDTAINGLMYLSADTIVGVSSNTGAAIIISTDKGKTWSFDPSSMTFFYPEMRAIARSAKDSVIMVGHSETTGTGIVYYYGDMFMNIFTADKDLNDVTMANDSVAFIAGDSGLLLSNVHIATAIKEASLSQNTVRIFPNPAHDLFTVQTDVPCSVSVWDMQGRCLIIGGTTAREHHIDMSAYAAGVYFVEAKPENGPAFRGKISLQ